MSRRIRWHIGDGTASRSLVKLLFDRTPKGDEEQRRKSVKLMTIIRCHFTNKKDSSSSPIMKVILILNQSTALDGRVRVFFWY